MRIKLNSFFQVSCTASNSAGSATETATVSVHSEFCLILQYFAKFKYIFVQSRLLTQMITGCLPWDKMPTFQARQALQRWLDHQASSETLSTSSNAKCRAVSPNLRWAELFLTEKGHFLIMKHDMIYVILSLWFWSTQCEVFQTSIMSMHTCKYLKCSSKTVWICTLAYIQGEAIGLSELMLEWSKRGCRGVARSD